MRRNRSMPTVPRACVICQAPFFVFASEARKGQGRFCSHACYHVWQREPIPLIERVWSKTERQPEGCWLWRGTISRDGYGMLRVKAQLRRVQRVVWELVNGPIPPGMMVCHTCDVRACIRPDHLWLGTNGDNVRDRNAKGRANLIGRTWTMKR